MAPTVTWMAFKSTVASSRLRVAIPARELSRMGIATGRDVLICSKHGWDWAERTGGFKKVVFDLCDDHLDHPKLAEHYRNACAQADAVTCNSREMARVIHRKTGRDAWVIPDPYEADLADPKVGENLIWFGHLNNIGSIAAWADRLSAQWRLMVLTGNSNMAEVPDGCVRWSPQAMDAGFDWAGIVVIPTDGLSPTKSANRAIEAIRRGRFPICGYLPAHGELGVYQGDIVDGVEWALANRDEVLDRIRSMQRYVTATFAPAVIALEWKRMLESL